MYGNTELRMRRALLDPAAAVPAGIGPYAQEARDRRFAVYRNNVALSLVEAMAGRFPVVRAIVGDEFFRAMAREFVLASPPRSPVLMRYGEVFPDFLASFGPAADLPYLADVARLEIARGQAFHAADAPPLTAEALAALDPQRRGVRVAIHPAVRLIRSAYPIVTLWAMNSGEQEPAAIDDWTGEDAVVTRAAYQILVRRLSPGHFAFLQALREGQTLEAAMMVGFAECEDFDASATLADLVVLGIATSLIQIRSRS
ncbi:hypothetical protein J2X65_000014 [Ancylobacter sp. 3268]|uniref:HvfC/BufC N-terminal domain-containing protein n=1 Tax=Ancylobacter sp. 3268 TaxID=2817752 RepID=UPI00285C1827|nr:DNA-binding domain-containing protein [Ancylobacter sp. 3268]MDR6950671.1 hypothetical protein [Ancylobacter sp. 3268]